MKVQSYRRGVVAIAGAFALIASFSGAAYACPSAAASTAESSAETVIDADSEIQHIEVLRRALSAGKADLIAQSVVFSSADDEVKFWRMYRQYEGELAEIGDKRIGLIKDYASTGGDLQAPQASAFMERAFDTEEASLALRRKYAEMISKDISPILGAQFAQLEGYIHRYTLLEIESQLPVVQALGSR